jgi:GT2 family glycosyltransferase
VQERPYSFLHVDIETVIVGKARAMLAGVAMEVGADVALFVDQDVEVPPHAIVALMDRGLPIVGGFYISRREPYLPQIYTLKGTEGFSSTMPGAQTTPRDVYWPIIDYDPESADIMEVDAIGAGCLLVRREVFERLAEQQEREDARLVEVMQHLEGYLAKEDYDLLHEHVRVMDPWFEFLTDEGEDMYFCRKARAAGYKVYVDLSVKCIHQGTVGIQEGHFRYIKPHLERVPPAPVQSKEGTN